LDVECQEVLCFVELLHRMRKKFPTDDDIKSGFFRKPDVLVPHSAGLPASILFGHGRMRRKDEDLITW